jgi:hypothetical protein
MKEIIDFGPCLNQITVLQEQVKAFMNIIDKLQEQITILTIKNNQFVEYAKQNAAVQ